MLRNNKKYGFTLNGKTMENGENHYLLVIPKLFGANKQIIMNSFKSGKLIRNCRYMQVDDFSEDLASIINTSREYGFIDRTGKEVIACQFQDASSFNEVFA